MVMILIAVILIILASAPIMFLVKNEITYGSRDLLIDAIYLYNQQSNNGYIPYDVLPSYDSTLYDFRIWSYKKILTKDIIDDLEPYIQEIRRKRNVKK